MSLPQRVWLQIWFTVCCSSRKSLKKMLRERNRSSPSNLLLFCPLQFFVTSCRFQSSSPYSGYLMWMNNSIVIDFSYLASRNRDRRIMTASQVLCFSCIWIDENFLWMIWTILSISFGVIGLVRLCSRRRFITWVVNSLHACNQKKSKKFINNLLHKYDN